MTHPAFNDSLHRLMHAYKRQLRAGIQQHHISLPITHIRVLKAICRIPGVTARDIAQRMDQDKAQITRALNELTRSGFIARTPNPHDKRSQLLAPTAEGQALLSKIERLEQQAVAQMTHNLDSQELASFVRIANIMIDNVAHSRPDSKGEQ
ncbi:MarR family transcriptional regulator [Oceanimonas sp. NS1]|uniref:MarR family winged helix-turn-helix transcriptional regulator n=1 Tax=Oceanimonas sp. MB9 TaxID=2588453 RepID=UPI0013F5F5C5|nr:MarR family transcriptional regulator [Oceanimonas sp. MB9]MCT7655620.1 MarR family transcriptional regulator [Oceanimonas sp. NS1]NHI00515.1 Multiple antibiotic resistance protein MarR [Oceanimonas sp. MB9]